MAKTVECARKGCTRDFEVGLFGSVFGHSKFCKICRVGLVDPGIRVRGGVGEVRFAPWQRPDRRTVTNSMLGIRPQSAARRQAAAARHGLANNPHFHLDEDDFAEPDLTVQLDEASGTAEVNFGFLDKHRGRRARADFAAARGLGRATFFHDTEPFDPDSDGGEFLDGEVINSSYL